MRGSNETDMNANTRKIFHWEKDFSKKMLRIALPVALQNLVAASAHIVDGLMVAGLGDTHYAAVTQAGRYSFLFQLFLFGAASGTSIFISQFWGKKDREGIHKVMSLCLRIAIGLAVLFAAGALLLPRQIMQLFLPAGESRDLAVEYLSWVGFSYLISGIDVVFSNTLRATGRPMVAMTAGICSIITNTVCNYAFIYGKFGAPAMGVKGAAIATVAAAAVSLAVNAGYTYWKHQPGAIGRKGLKMPDGRFSLDYIKRVLPVVFNEGLWSLGVTTYSAFYGTLGDAAVNAVGVYNSIEQLMTVFIFGVVNASAILIGNCIGAGDREATILTSKRMMLASEAVSTATGLMLVLMRGPILSLFGNLSTAALKDASTILLIAGIAMPFRYFNTINIVGVLRAGGDTVYSMVLDSCSVWLIGVPCVALTTLVFKWPITWVFLSTTIEELFKMSLGIPRFLSGKWINNLTTIGDREGSK